MKQIHRESQYVSDINSATDIAAWSFPQGAEIVEISVTPLGTDAGGATIEFDSLVSTTRGAADVGTVTLAASNLQGQAQVEVPSAGLVRVAAGGSVIAQVASEGVTALPVVVSIAWRNVGEYNANSDNVDAA